MWKKTLFLIPVLAAVACASTLQGQQRAPSKLSEANSSAELPTADIPVTNLSLLPGKPAPGVERSAVVVQPVECTSKGDIVLEIPHQPDFSTFNVVSLSLDGSRTFDLRTDPKLNDTRLLSVFPGDGKELFLVVATTDPAQTEVKSQGLDGQGSSRKVWQGEHHNFLVVFGLDGVYQSTIDLPSKIDTRKAAELHSGEFLLLGYDPVNRIPRLQLVSASGLLVRDLDIPGEFLQDETLRKGEAGEQWEVGSAATSLSHWQMTYVEGKIVLYKPHTHAPALEVGPGGAVREVPITPPAGYELDALLQSTTRWLARFRRAGVKKNAEGGFDSSGPANNYLLAELDSTDGSVRREFGLGKETSPFDIACEADNKLMSFSMDMGSQFLISSTELPR